MNPMSFDEDRFKKLIQFGEYLQSISFKQVEDSYVLDVFGYCQPAFEDCELLIQQNYPHRSKEDIWKSNNLYALYMSFERLCLCKETDADHYIQSILKAIPSIRLLEYSIEKIFSWNRQWLIGLYLQQLVFLLQKKINNASVLRPYNLYITHSTLTEITRFFPEKSRDLLSTIFEVEWDAGWRMSAAEALEKNNQSTDASKPYYVLKQWQHPYFQKVESFREIKIVMDYYISMRCYSQSIAEIIPLENHLAFLYKQSKSEEIKNFLQSKWQCSDWRKRNITLENNWEFSLARSPYAEVVSCRIPGGETARDDVRPSYPEQLDWLHKTLTNAGVGHYSVSWEIDFTIHSEKLLQHFLQAIEHLHINIVNDEKTRPTLDDMAI